VGRAERGVEGPGVQALHAAIVLLRLHYFCVCAYQRSHEADCVLFVRA
jgi:hypothetical protein